MISLSQKRIPDRQETGKTGDALAKDEICRRAARPYGYSVAEFTALNVTRLLAPGMRHAVLESPEDSAVGPLAMKHFRKSGDSMDVEVWLYGTFLDGRRVNTVHLPPVPEAEGRAECSVSV